VNECFKLWRQWNAKVATKDLGTKRSDSCEPKLSHRMRPGMSPARLDKVCNVGWHLLDLSVVELLQLSQGSDVLLSNKVDGNSLPSESTTASNSVNVILQVSWQVVVNDK